MIGCTAGEKGRRLQKKTSPDGGCRVKIRIKIAHACPLLIHGPPKHHFLTRSDISSRLKRTRRLPKQRLPQRRWRRRWLRRIQQRRISPGRWGTSACLASSLEIKASKCLAGPGGFRSRSASPGYRSSNRGGKGRAKGGRGGGGGGMGP